MKVRIIKNLTTPHGEIPAGKIITIPDHLLEKLKGKVEPIVDTSPYRGPVEIVTSEGDNLWVAMDNNELRRVPTGAVFFMGDEIMQLQKAGGDQALRVMFMVKQVFGNDSRLIEPGYNHDLKKLKSKLN